MTVRRLLALLAAAVLAVLVACGGGDDAENGDGDDPTDTGGDPTTEVGADLGDFPVDLPAWAEAVTPNIGGGGLDVVLFNVPLDQRDATVEFYESWTAAQTESFIRTDSDSGGVTFQGDVAVGEERTTVSILSALDGDDFVSVSVSHGVFE